MLSAYFVLIKANEVKSPPCENLSPVARQILDYLNSHKDAQDTIEGIAEWWLLEQRIRIVITEVKNALAELEDQGMVLAEKSPDGRVHYRLNRRQLAAVDDLLGKLSVQPPAAPKKTMAKKSANRR